LDKDEFPNDAIIINNIKYYDSAKDFDHNIEIEITKMVEEKIRSIRLGRTADGMEEENDKI